MAKIILANSGSLTNKNDADLIYIGCCMVQAIEKLSIAVSPVEIRRAMKYLNSLRNKWVDTFLPNSSLKINNM